MSKLQINDNHIIHILNILLCFFQLTTKFVEHSHSWEANSYSASQEIPSLCGDEFINVPTRAHEWSLFFSTWIQYIPSKLFIYNKF
jgi:hypothetical protein